MKCHGKKVADAYGAAKDRESHFPSSFSDEQLTPKRYYDGRLDSARFDRALEHTHKTRMYPQKFRQEALRRLSQELFGTDSVEEAIMNAMGTERFQDVLSKISEYQDGVKYIVNNKTRFNWR